MSIRPSSVGCHYGNLQIASVFVLVVTQRDLVSPERVVSRGIVGVELNSNV